jgi:hypothetical protein
MRRDAFSASNQFSIGAAPNLSWIGLQPRRLKTKALFARSGRGVNGQILLHRVLVVFGALGRAKRNAM